MRGYAGDDGYYMGKASGQASGRALRSPGVVNNSSGLMDTLGGIASVGIPALGLGIQGVGGLMDYFEGKKQEEAMQQELDRQRSDRDYAKGKYMSELSNDSAMRDMMRRGQITNTPFYQQQLGRLAREGQAQQQVTSDNMQKMGMGDKSGLFSQLAGQNLSNVQNSAIRGTGQALQGQNRVYGGLSPYAMSSSPEQSNFNNATRKYGEASDYGQAFSNLFKLGTMYNQSNARTDATRDMHGQIGKMFQ